MALYGKVKNIEVTSTLRSILNQSAEMCSLHWIIDNSMREKVSRFYSPVFYSSCGTYGWYLSITPKPAEGNPRISLWITSAPRYPTQVDCELDLTLTDRSRVLHTKKSLRYVDCKTGKHLCYMSSFATLSVVRVVIKNFVHDSSNDLRSTIIPLRNIPHYGELNAPSVKMNIDLNMVVQGSTIPAHQVVVAASSPVLEAMMLELPQSDSVKVLMINDFSVEVIRTLVDYIYSKESPNFETLSPETVFDVLQCASKYEVVCLHSIVCDYLESCFSVQNITKTVIFADRHNEQELKDKAINFMCANKASLAKHGMFKDLEKVPALMAQILERMAYSK